MKKPNIRLSVVLAVHNGEKYISQAVESILNQTFPNFEFIIINDGSTDSTSRILNSHTDPRIRLIENKLNRGLVACLNTGIMLSRGKYIARMDADDIADLHRLEKQFDFMESHPEIGICGSYIRVFFEGTGKSQVVKFPENDKAIRAFTFFQAPFSHPSVMLRKSVLDSYELEYPDQFYRAEDYAFWTELLKYTQAANLPEVLLHYRRHQTNETVLSDKQSGDKNLTLSKIQYNYLTHNRLYLSEEKMLVYAHFVNRSIQSYNLSHTSQRYTENILKSFFSQLKQVREDLFSDSIRYCSEICFYRFIIGKCFPKTRYMLQLFSIGGFHFLKRNLFN